MILVIAGGAFVFLPGLKNAALALTGNYGKTTGDNLDISDWNNLDDDFLAKSGGTMTGDLSMGNKKITNVATPTAGTDAANQAYVLNQISDAGSIKDTSGNTLNLVCGETSTSDWQTYTDGHTVYVDVDMTAAGFTSIPYVFTSLNGDAWHWKTYGMTSLYSRTSTGFRVYIYNLGTSMTASDAVTWGWTLSWCGISN